MSDIEIFLDEWGEEIIYHPKSGNPRRILAVVDRNAPTPIGEAGAGMRQQINIHVANRGTDKDDDDYGGIGSVELDTGGDKVSLSLRLGGELQVRPLIGLLEQDDDALTLEVG